MTVSTPIATYYSPNLELLCAHVKRMSNDDDTKRFRIRRNSKGLWRMMVY